MTDTGPKFTWAEKKAALARQLRPYRNLLVALGVVEVFAAIANGVIPYLTGKFFDALITPHVIALPGFGTSSAWRYCSAPGLLSSSSRT